MAGSGDTIYLQDRQAVRIDLAIHVLAIALAASGLLWIRIAIVYLSTVLIMFIFSAAYNVTRKWWLRRADHASIFFLAMTMCASFIPPAIAPLPFIAVGSALYLIGVQFLIRPHMRFHNAIWHSFVVVACACHYGALLT